MSIEVRNRAESEPGGLERVHLRDAGLLQMRRGAKLELPRTGEQGLHDLGPVRAELQSFDAVLGGPLDPRECRFRRLDRALVPARARPLEIHDARCDDFVPIAALALLDREGVIGERNADDRRYAMREPELVGVFGFGTLRRLAAMLVKADESRQHVHAGRVDFELGVLRLTVGAKRNAWRTGAANRLNPVVLDDDVDGADGWRPAAVDENRAANDQRLEGAAAFVGPAVGTRRQRRWGRLLRDESKVERDGDRGGNQADALHEILAMKVR